MCAAVQTTDCITVKLIFSANLHHQRRLPTQKILGWDGSPPIKAINQPTRNLMKTKDESIDNWAAVWSIPNKASTGQWKLPAATRR